MKIPIITEFELKRVVKKKWFLISTILTPFLIIFYAAFPVILGKAAQKKRVIGFVDRTGRVIAHFSSKKNAVKISLRTLKSLKGGEALLDAKKIDCVIVIDKNFLKNKKATLYMRNVADIALITFIRSTLTQITERFELENMGIDPNKLKEILREVKLKTLKFEKGKISKETMQSVFVLYMIFSMLLFMGLIGYGQILLRRVIEDKRSRIVEVLYSSATPYQLFMGKLLGVGIAGIIQIAIWLFLAVIGYFYGSSLLPNIAINSFFSKFVLFLIFFFSGFFLYSTIFLTVGSLVDTEEDAQHLMGPIMMVITLPFALSFILMQVPESWVTIFFSYFPYSAPYFMMMRATISSVSIVEIILSVIVVILTSMGSVWASSRIFRVGMLHTGKRPTISEVIRWISK